METTAAKRTAIPFELPTMDGDRRSLNGALAAGPVLLAFFKVGCPTCQYTFPFLERLHGRFKAQGVQIWGISQDGEQDTRKFAQTFGVTFPLLIDAKPYKVSAEYRLKFVPSLFLVGGDGRVEIFGDGFSKQDFLAVQAYLAKHYQTAPPPLFGAGEKIPEYKPG
jgi:peroxiredoxin